MAQASLPTVVYEAHATLIQSNPHYENALLYYGEALRRLQQKTDDESSLRTALQSCILFICFEVLNGNCESALKHTTHGLQILKDIKNGLSPSDKVEITMTFRRINIFIVSMQPRLGGKLAPVLPLPIPCSFANLHDAWFWWTYVMRWMLELESKTAKAPSLYLPGIPELRQENEERLKAWDAAFQPLYRAAVQNENKDEEAYLMCISMRFQYVQHWISTRSVCFFRTEVLDELTGQFCELNQLAGILLPKQKSVAGFSGAFSLDVVPTLGLQITSARCRDAAVRDDAQRLLNAYPRRDCFWDNRSPNFWAKGHVLS